MNKSYLYYFLATLLSFVVTGTVWSDTSPDGSCPDEEVFDVGFVSVTTGQETQSVEIDVSEGVQERFEPLNLDDVLLFQGAILLEGAALAQQLGFSPDEFVEKFQAAPEDVRNAGFVALAADRQFEGIGFAGQLAVFAFTDPVQAFEFSYTNTSDVEQTVNFQLPLNIDPTPYEDLVTPARSYLEVDLIDANDDGAATLDHTFGNRGFMDSIITVNGSGIAFLVDEEGNGFFPIGDELVAPTTETQIFDTDVAALKTFALFPDEVTEIGPSLSFIISPGDEARFRGVITVAQTEGLLADPLLVLDVLDNGFQPIPEPTSAALLMLPFLIIAARRR